MNDGKFRQGVVDGTGKEIGLLGDYKLALIKMSNGEVIPEDEPIFIFRGRDYLAIPALINYMGLSAKDGCTEYQIAGMVEAIERFRKFAESHPERMKQPGVTRGA